MFAANENYPGAIFGFLPQFSVGAAPPPVVAPVVIAASTSDSSVNFSVTPSPSYTHVDFEVRPK